jgi:integrase
MGLTGATYPKSWRHTFATLLQDANVDPLIRQQTLGHQPGSPGAGALGMTTVYTHSRPETQRREILRALRLWPLSLEFARRRASDVED